MEIIFYTCNSDRRKINKELTEIHRTEILLKLAQTSVTTPVINVNYFDNFAAVNYCYIPKLGRYYFVNTSILKGAIVQYSCKVDVLMSYATEILNSNGLIYNRGSQYNILIPDSRSRQMVNEDIVNIPFTGGELTNRFGTGDFNYILTAYRPQEESEV